MAKTLFPYIAEDGLMGYKDLTGNVKIAAQWDQVKSFGYKAGLLASVSVTLSSYSVVTPAMAPSSFSSLKVSIRRAF